MAFTLNVIVRSVVMLNVIILKVVALFSTHDQLSIQNGQIGLSFKMIFDQKLKMSQ
jgi:hypothetical protein